MVKRNTGVKDDVRMQRKSGFTLVELLVVMVILSVLAVIVTSTFSSSIRRGRDSRRKEDLRALSGALEAYFNDKGQYPLGVSGKMAGCGTADAQVCEWGEEMRDSEETLYMVIIPEDPLGTQQYYYVSADGSTYAAYAKLENTLDQGAGADQDGYPGTDCSSGGTEIECTYGISSTDTTP